MTVELLKHSFNVLFLDYSMFSTELFVTSGRGDVLSDSEAPLEPQARRDFESQGLRSRLPVQTTREIYPVQAMVMPL